MSHPIRSARSACRQRSSMYGVLWLLVLFTGGMFSQASEASVSDSSALFTPPPSGQGNQWDTARSVIFRDVSASLDRAGNLLLGTGSQATSLWLYSAGLGVAGLLAYQLDSDLQTTMLRNQGNTARSVFNVCNAYGEGYSAVGIAGLAYLGGLVLGDSNLRQTGIEVAEVVTYSGLIVVTLKSILGRSRPYVNSDRSDFRWFETNNDFLAMPSGHTAVAFAISSVLARRIDHWAADVLLYGLATGTGVARMYRNAHWFSDTVVGALIACGVSSLNHRLNWARANVNVGCGPLLQPNGIGMALNTRIALP